MLVTCVIVRRFILLTLSALGICSCLQGQQFVSPTIHNRPVMQTILPQTHDIAGNGEENFSISPDGRWLFFLSQQSTLTTPLFILYDLKDSSRYEIQLTDAVRNLIEEMRGPLNHIGCWDESSIRIFLPSVDTTTIFVIDVADGSFRLDIHEQVSQAEYKVYYECNKPAVDPMSIVRLVQDTPQQIDILQAQTPNTQLANHHATATENRLVIDYLLLSPDQTMLTYVITGYRGSFISASRGFVLNIAARQTTPQMLTEKVFGPLRWGPESDRIYGNVGQTGGETNIIEWQIR